MANHFVLKHDELEVVYDIGRNPSMTVLSYADGNGNPTNFAQIEVTVTETPLGELVCVPLLKSVDVGGEMFGFFLPVIDVPEGACEKFTTRGVYASYSGPDSIPNRPESWRCIELHGTGETVIQPL